MDAAMFLSGDYANTNTWYDMNYPKGIYELASNNVKDDGIGRNKSKVFPKKSKMENSLRVLYEERCTK